MLASLSSAVSGLSAHQTKMDVIGNNIANINTYGFKSSRVTFTDVFYQTLATASSSSTDSGGTNPTQLGYGSQVNSIDVINTRAGSTTTDRALDVYINGDGYLAVKDSDGAIKYTRVGIMSFDSSGNLVDSSGKIVLGLSTNPTTGQIALNSDGTTDTSNLVAISVDPDVYATYTDITIGQNGEITATEQGDPTVTMTAGTGWITDAKLPESSNYTGEISMTAKTNSVALTNKGTYSDGTTAINGVTIPSTADILGNVKLTYSGASSTYTLNYTNTAGESKSINATNSASDPLSFDVKAIDGSTVQVTADTSTAPADTGTALVWPTTAGIPDSTTLTLGTVTAATKAISISTYDKSGAAVTQSATWSAGNTAISLGDLSLTVNSSDLAALKDFTGTKIGSAGTGDGKTITFANLALVKFANADGLSQDGEGYYVETTNSGNAVATVAGNGGTGTLVSGALESSNVDLSQELTEMIITQRGFQANSKMITVSDEMLETLVNMKR